MTDAEIVIRTARRTLGNPAKRAAKATRDAAIGRLASAHQRGEAPAILRRLQAEADATKAEYLQVLRTPIED